MTTWLKQSTAADVELGPFIDDTDGKTPETSLTISQADCQLIKNGGAAAQKNSSTAATHLGGGHYKIPLDATDTGTLGRLRLYVNESGALPAWRDFIVLDGNAYDALIAGTGAVRSNVTQWNGTNVATPDTAGHPKVTVKSGTGTGEISLSGGKALLQDASITAAVIATGAVDADALAADAVDEILDEVVEGSLTMRQILRVMLAALAGESTGGGTSTITFRDAADTKARITATVDGSRNRTAVTVDGT